MSFVLYTQILKQSVLKPASPGITLRTYVDNVQLHTGSLFSRGNSAAVSCLSWFSTCSCSRSLSATFTFAFWADVSLSQRKWYCHVTCEKVQHNRLSIFEAEMLYCYHLWHRSCLLYCNWCACYVERMDHVIYCRTKERLQTNKFITL